MSDAQSNNPKIYGTDNFIFDPKYFGLKKKKKIKKLVNKSPDVTLKNITDFFSQKSENEDYTYDELIDRAYSLLKKDKPELARADEHKKLTLKPPQVDREGTRVRINNFKEICKSFGRFYNNDYLHVKKFIETEMGTCCSLDSLMHLFIKGRYTEKERFRARVNKNALS
jgi:translation initiation factor 2 subunit 2